MIMPISLLIGCLEDFTVEQGMGTSLRILMTSVATEGYLLF
jgi:hypothetical protein